MDSLILIIIATCIFLPYMICQYRRKKKHTGEIMSLHQVEAGPTRGFSIHKKIDLMSTVDVDMESISVNPELQYFVVKNQCMQLKGISDGDIVGVRMFEHKHSMLDSLKRGQILLIYLDDKHFKGYKIRELGTITDDGVAYNTYHYKGGVQHRSTRPHSIDSLKGVVVEVHERQYIGSLN